MSRETKIGLTIRLAGGALIAVGALIAATASQAVGAAIVVLALLGLVLVKAWTGW